MKLASGSSVPHGRMRGHRREWGYCSTTPAEIGRFLARAKEEGYYELFLLELSTGMRRGEILGLKWSDLNLTDGSLRIAREVVPAGGKIVIQPPKTKNSIRTVVLPPYMVAILAEMKKSKTCEWIFPSPVKQARHGMRISDQ